MKAGDQEYQHLLQIFREECREHVTKLNEGLLTLEQGPQDGLLDALLRAAHSLKGAARMMGLKEIETMAHQMESLLGELKRGEKETDGSVIERLYRAVDEVATAVEALEGTEIKAQSVPQTVKPHQVSQAEETLTTIRVETENLDTLVNLAGELLVTKIGAFENLRRMEEVLDALKEWPRKVEGEIHPARIREKIESLSSEIQTVFRQSTENTFQLERLVNGVHDGLQELRLLPLSTILGPFPRMVRDLSRELGKKAEIVFQGASTRLDKKVLEELREPLIHLVRNALDHGIEAADDRANKGKPRQGKIEIAARQEKGRVIVTVSDDGGGLKREAIVHVAADKELASLEELANWPDEAIWELIFRPGFTTASSVTEISGRGVGLDAVVARVEDLEGSIQVHSSAEGLTFTLSLPITLSTAHTLLFQCGGEVFCLPTDALEKTLLVPAVEITTVEGKNVFVVDGEPLAFAWMADLLGLPRTAEQNGSLPALILSTSRGRAVLAVEALLGEEEVVLKGLGKLFDTVRIVLGGTILGNGQIALILSAHELIRSLSHQARPGSAASVVVRPQPTAEKKRILVVDDSITSRTLEKDILEAASFDVTTAVDGEEALVKLYEKKFDLVVSDVQMPRMDGITFTSTIKRIDRFKKIPVVLVTALQSDGDKRKGLEAGADAYITKAAFDHRRFLEIVQRFA